VGALDDERRAVNDKLRFELHEPGHLTVLDPLGKCIGTVK